MEHKAYIRPVEGARFGVLLIHGIVGTPGHFRELLPLIPEDWSVYNILLDGHGGEVGDFSKTSMAKWKAQVSAQMDEILLTHERVLLVGHSLGTLFAMAEGIRHADRVAGLFLLAVPLTPRVLPSTAYHSLRAALGCAKPGTPAMAMVEDSSVRLTPELYRYLGWIPRFWELLMECRAARGFLPELTVPCRCFQSRKDELVSRGAKKLLAGNSRISLAELPDSGHFSYSQADMAYLQAQFREMLEAIALQC